MILDEARNAELLAAFDRHPRRVDDSGAEFVTARFVLGGAQDMEWSEHLVIARDPQSHRCVVPMAVRLLGEDWEIGAAEAA